MLEQHGSTRSSRLARHVERVVSRRDVTRQVVGYLGFIKLYSLTHSLTHFTALEIAMHALGLPVATATRTDVAKPARIDTTS